MACKRSAGATGLKRTLWVSRCVNRLTFGRFPGAPGSRPTGRVVLFSMGYEVRAFSSFHASRRSWSSWERVTARPDGERGGGFTSGTKQPSRSWKDERSRTERIARSVAASLFPLGDPGSRERSTRLRPRADLQSSDSGRYTGRCSSFGSRSGSTSTAAPNGLIASGVPSGSSLREE